MAIFEESVNIKCPVDKAFAYTTDIKSWPIWFSSLTEATQTSQGQFGIGTTFTVTSKAMGLKTRMTGKITGLDPNKTWDKEFGTRSLAVKVRYSHDFIDGNTKVTQHFDIKLTGFLKLFSSMFAKSVQKQAKVALNNLKGILEAQG
jgi:hypothetical protein